MSGRPKNKTKPGSASTHSSAPLATIHLILALPEDLDYFHEIISTRSGWTAPSSRGRFSCWFVTSHGSVLVIIQTLPAMGNIEASLLAGAGIAQANPDLVVMVGLAGSMNPTVVHLGDVVISNQAKLYVSDKVKAFESTAPGSGIRRYRFNDQPPVGSNDIVIDRRDALMSKSFLRYERKYVESTPTDQLISDMELRLRTFVEQLPRVDPDHVPKTHRDGYTARGKVKLHSGWILASQHVVDSAEYRQYLQQKNTDLTLDVHRQTGEQGRSQWKSGDLLAVDMESYGLLRAVELLRTTPEIQGGVRQLIGGIVVRGISDLCEEKSESDAGSGQATRKIAVQNATEVALTIIETIDYRRLLRR